MNKRTFSTDIILEGAGWC